MLKPTGNDRVLDALSATVPALRSVDLRPVPSAASSAPAGEAGRYVELGELGRGGLGVVLEVFDRDLRRVVALKRLHEGVPSHGDVETVVREAQVQAQLEHPNVAAVHALGVDAQGRAFFTMTRLRGATLADLLARRSTDRAVRDQLGLPRLLRIATQVGHALAFAHAHGVLHRDVKPSNVVLGEYGEVRLMDWGIAKLLESAGEPAPQTAGLPAAASIGKVVVDSAGTLGGGFVGTPGYAAPEQAAGGADLDARADVYALGALLYEMLAGRPPVVGATVDEVIRATIAGAVTPVDRIVPVSRTLAAVVHKALATRREERYATMRALTDDLEALQDGRRVTAIEEGTVRRFWRIYGGRGPRTARLCTRDVDLLCWGSFLLGMPTGALALQQAGASADALSWAFVAAGLLAFVPPLHTLLRKPRPDDPGALVAFADVLPSSRPASGGSAPLAFAATEASAPAARGQAAPRP